MPCSTTPDLDSVEHFAQRNEPMMSHARRVDDWELAMIWGQGAMRLYANRKRADEQESLTLWAQTRRCIGLSSRFLVVPEDTFVLSGVYANVGFEGSALQWVMRSGDGFNQDIGHGTEACRYWLDDDAETIFITHFLWSAGVDEPQGELFRVDVVDTWIAAYNLVERIIRVKIAVSRQHKDDPKFESSGEYFERHEEVCNYMVKIQTLLDVLSEFLARLVYIERTTTAPSCWTEVDIPTHIRHYALTYMTESDHPSLPFQIILQLQSALPDATELDSLRDLEIYVEDTGKYVRPLLRRPGGIWRKAIKGLGEDEEEMGEFEITGRNVVEEASMERGGVKNMIWSLGGYAPWAPETVAHLGYPPKPLAFDSAPNHDGYQVLDDLVEGK